MTGNNDISPLGQTARQASGHRAARSSEYREQQVQLAPYRDIARTVILARASKGWTQEELATRLGTTKSAVSRIESGRHAVNIGTVRRLADVLDTSFTIAPTRQQHSGRSAARAVAR